MGSWLCIEAMQGTGFIVIIFGQGKLTALQKFVVLSGAGKVRDKVDSFVSAQDLSPEIFSGGSVVTNLAGPLVTVEVELGAAELKGLHVLGVRGVDTDGAGGGVHRHISF